MPRADRHVPTQDEVKKMLKIARDKDLEDYIFLLLAANTGARLEELLGIKVKDINFDFHRGFIKIKTLKREEGDLERKYRDVPINAKVVKDLLIYVRDKNLKRTDKLFSKSRRRFQQLIKHYARLAKIDNYEALTPHSFRDFFITELRRRKWTYEDISKITGHADIKSLQRVYDHTDVYDVEEKFRKTRLVDL